MAVFNISYTVPSSILIWDATIKLHSFIGEVFLSILKCNSARDTSEDIFINNMILQTSMCIVVRVCVGLVTYEGDESYCLYRLDIRDNTLNEVGSELLVTT